MRLAQLGAAYLSLSVGGKFEDAVHTPGQVPYPYTGYSGDRCMPGDWYPAVPHAHFSAEIKAFVKRQRLSTRRSRRPERSPTRTTRNGWSAAGAVDIVGIARGLLADPDWPNKVRSGERRPHRQVRLLQRLQASRRHAYRVICALWPQGSLQAPPDDRAPMRRTGNAEGANLAATHGEGKVTLKWNKAAAAPPATTLSHRYAGKAEVADAVKVTRWEDHNLLAGMPYRYHVRAYGAAGQGGASSNTITVSLPMANYAGRT